MDRQKLGDIFREWWPVFTSMVGTIIAIVLVYAAIDKRLALIEDKLTDVATLQNQVMGMEGRLGTLSIRVNTAEVKLTAIEKIIDRF